MSPTEGERLGEESVQAKEQEYPERTEIVAFQDPCPGDEPWDKNDHTVMQDDVEVIGRRGNVGFTNSHTEKGSEIRHGCGDGFFEHCHEDPKEGELHLPVKQDCLNDRPDTISEEIHQQTAQEDPQQDQSQSHTDDGMHDPILTSEKVDQGCAEDQIQPQQNDKDGFQTVKRIHTLCLQDIQWENEKSCIKQNMIPQN